jgi:hypothetical protein
MRMENTLQALFSSPHIVDLLLAFLLLETVLLLILRKHRGWSVSKSGLLLNAAAGAMLMLALRTVLSDASWYWLALCLFAAGVLHALQLLTQHATSTPHTDAAQQHS